MKDEKKVVAISPSRVHLSEYKQVRRTAFAPVGTSPDDLVDPDFWRHVARDIKPCDEMVVFCEDMAWRAEVCFVSTGPVSARASVLKVDRLSPGDSVDDDDDGLSVGWGGLHHKHRVVSKKGGNTEVIAHGFESKEDALAALREYRKTHGMAAA